MAMGDSDSAEHWWHKAYTCLNTLSGTDSSIAHTLQEHLRLVQTTPGIMSQEEADSTILNLMRDMMSDMKRR